MQCVSLDTLSELASQVGLTLIGSAGVEELSSDRVWLQEWQARGLAGEMKYMQRSPQLLATPTLIAPGIRSVVTVAVAYDRTPRQPGRVGFGRVARYAWGRDYHKVLRRRLENLVALVQKRVGRPFAYRVFSDSVPLLERALALRAGMGFIGKNTMLIRPKTGSFFFLGEILWELEVVHDKPPVSLAVLQCGSCTRCLAQCPTNAFVSERVLDASRCISYLTIEKRGALREEERTAIGEWIFGCDICQEVCPFNTSPLKKGLRADVPELRAEQGVGELLSLKEVLALRDVHSFEGRFAGTALMRAKREGLLRNAALVAANTGAVDLIATLAAVAAEDPSAVVRQHALWSYVALAASSGEVNAGQVRQRLSQARHDADTVVANEAELLLSRLPN